MTTLLFVRHGQASFGQNNYDKLSQLGEQQAQLLGSSYAHHQRKIDALVTGSLVRQQDSASHFLSTYQSINPLPDPFVIEGLNEFNHKDVFIKSNPMFKTQAGILAAIADAPIPKVRLAELFNQAMQRWHSGKYDAEYIESWSEFNTRVQQALKQVIAYAQTLDKQKQQDSSTTVLIFTSGGVIAAITAALLGQGSQTAYQINRSLVNTGVTSIKIKDNKAKLLSLNEHSHLFANHKNYLTWQ